VQLFCNVVLSNLQNKHVFVRYLSDRPVYCDFIITVHVFATVILISSKNEALAFCRSTFQQSQPNKAGLQCSPVRSFAMHTYVRPQKVSLISVKFGM